MLPATASDIAVTMLPATAALPAVAIDPATAVLATVATDPATPALATVAADPATPVLATVATDRTTAVLAAVASESTGPLSPSADVTTLSSCATLWQLSCPFDAGIGSQRAEQRLAAPDTELVDGGLTQLLDALDHAVSQCVEHVLAQIYWGRA